MSDQRKLKFSTDLCTFYSPVYWGQPAGLEGLFTGGGWDPLRFWERILDGTREAGIDGIEITFAPGDWHCALQAFGSAKAFGAAVQDRGLAVSSGFLSTTDHGTGRQVHYEDRADHALALEGASAYAEFLHDCGASLMVVSLPLRKSRDAEPPLIIDLAYASTVADLLNRMGAATLKHGVRLVLHPEAFTVFRNSRDVDLFMTLTDPTYVNLCPDTAQFTVAGSDPIEIASRHRDRVQLAHFKDAVGPAPLDVPIDDTIWDRQVQWFTPVGTGVVDWPRWMRLLRDLHYEGWAVFELDNAPDPVAALKTIREYVERALLPIYR